jgi:imidazolonepropionase-like amidohydrolase
MRRIVLALAVLAGACQQAASSQVAAPSPSPAAAPPRQERWSLYKFGQRIGAEHATTASAADGRAVVRTTFTFNDRGTDVPLAGQWALDAGGAPRLFQAWGFVARGVSSDDSVIVGDDGSVEIARQEEPARRVRAPALYAAVSGYAPVVGQELMVRAWLSHGRPADLPLLPEGTARIQSRGFDDFRLGGATLHLEHLAVLGLVWGREDVWIDDKGALVALVTRDAEFDHFEAVQRGHEPLLDAFVRRAGEDAIAWLGEGARTGGAPAGPLAIVGARLVDAGGAPPIEDGVVVVDGDRIVAAGPRAATPVPADARRIDGAGATVVPGLWDMHAHLEQVEQAAAYLAAGVTTVRDEGNILSFITAVRDAIDGGRGVGPCVIVDCLVDSDHKQALGTLRVNAVEDVAPLVDRAVQAGCAEIKIYSSLKPPLVAPLCAEAHRRGLRVTGHVPTNMDINDALDAGFDGVNHIQYVTSLALPKKQDDIDKLPRDEQRRRIAAVDVSSPGFQQLFARMAAAHTLYDPTLALFELFLHPGAELARREPGLAKMPRELRGSYGGGMDPDDVAMNARIFQTYVAAVREMHRRGVVIVAGTDIGVPGHSLPRELELYVQAGFTPLEALAAATIVPARMLGRDRELGTIAAGKRADLALVDGDPLADIRALRRVKLTVARGRAYDPAAMWKLAGFEP